MREYWVPAMVSSEVAEPDCDPVRVMLLGEQLIGFRDSSGRVGLVQGACPHRGASLFYGRNEDNGLRCVYHGWKFDVAGKCMDMPNEPPESIFKHKVSARAYPCVERGGIVWAYLGSREEPPPLPDLEANMLPADASFVRVTQRECNWLQALEGDIDDSHVAFLHFGAVNPDDMPAGSFALYASRHRRQSFEVQDADYGVLLASCRPAEPGTSYWRIGQFLFPFYTHIPTGILGHQIRTHAWVPMDDYHVLTYRFGALTHEYDEDVDTSDEEPGATAGFQRLRRKVLSPAKLSHLPNTTGWHGRFRRETNAGNDYNIDRKLQRTDSFTGLGDFNVEDQMVTESMGPIYDRSKEHLGSTDLHITRVRRRLLDAARALTDNNITPPGVDNPHVYGIRSGGIVLPDGTDWLDTVQRLGNPGEEHPDLDLTGERFF
jgi:phenylpropionate dioxygenase-like ring-hydroxylating dioxygenase large terminal subunit